MPGCVSGCPIVPSVHWCAPRKTESPAQGVGETGQSQVVHGLVVGLVRHQQLRVQSKKQRKNIPARPHGRFWNPWPLRVSLN